MKAPCSGLTSESIPWSASSKCQARSKRCAVKYGWVEQYDDCPQLAVMLSSPVSPPSWPPENWDEGAPET